MRKKGLKNLGWMQKRKAKKLHAYNMNWRLSEKLCRWLGKRYLSFLERNYAALFIYVIKV